MPPRVALRPRNDARIPLKGYLTGQEELDSQRMKSVERKFGCFLRYPDAVRRRNSAEIAGVPRDAGAFSLRMS